MFFRSANLKAIDMTEGVGIDQVIETLRWRDGHLEMVDQRVLPASFRYLSYGNALEVAEGIRSMVVRGAPAIGCAAAYGIALEALSLRQADHKTFLASIEKSFAVLAESRPTAVNLFWALKRMRAKWGAIQTRSQVEIAGLLLEEAHEISSEDIRINRAMGAFGAALLPDGARVLTHCNAGALATAGHGTALGVFRSTVEIGKKISVFVDETRPFLQGARLTAWEMVQEKIPVTLITDNMSGHLMSLGEIDAVVVGTDRVAANGDVANKIGTYMVAVLAQRHNIPFYVACPLSTIDLSVSQGSEIPIEERSPDEVTGFREVQWAAKGVQVRNPGFDITPAELVTALITEKGVIKHPNNRNIAALFEVKF
jgi:methylthioribose-1-phosphate isomerase